MSNFNQAFEQSKSAVANRSILKNVYVWMTLGLALTGVIAYGVSSNEAILGAIFGTPGLLIGLIIGQVALVWIMSANLMKFSAVVASLMFAGYSALNGLTLSVIFLVYTEASIAQVFFITAGTFAAMSLWAITTKKDLSGWGHFLFMGVIGLVIASVVNLLLRSEAMYFLISMVGVVVFTGLTAYDTQQIKRMSDSYGENIVEEDYVRLSILGALKLYLDFINLFLYLLRLLGGRK